MPTRLPAELVPLLIVDSSAHRSRLLGLSCRALAVHRAEAVIDALRRGAESLEAQVGLLGDDVARVAREIQADHASWIADAIVRETLRVRGAVATTRGGGSRITVDEAGVGQVLALEVSPPRVRVRTELALGMLGGVVPARLIRSSLDIRVDAFWDAIITPPTCGEIEMEGFFADGRYARTSVSYRDNRVIGALRAIGFY